MALVVNTNMNSLTIEGILANTNDAVSSSLQKLSSGLRINSAQDDPAGFAIANDFKAKVASMQVASQNANQAVSMLQTADGAYSQINDILVQMKSLATEAASGQEGTTDLNSLQNEFSDLGVEIDKIANSTQYGSTSLINNSNTITFQVGAINDTGNNNMIGLTFENATQAGLGINTLNISTNGGASAAMTTLDNALTSINTFMGDVGGYQNQLQYTINNLTTGIQNFTASASTIEDVDMASEVSNLTKNQILQQSAMAMLAQANAQPQSILKLLS
jgi:flagellin